jgi:hypothetical protein
MRLKSEFFALRDKLPWSLEHQADLDEAHRAVQMYIASWVDVYPELCTERVSNKHYRWMDEASENTFRNLCVEYKSLVNAVINYTGQDPLGRLPLIAQRKDVAAKIEELGEQYPQFDWERLPRSGMKEQSGE